MWCQSRALPSAAATASIAASAPATAESTRRAEARERGGRRSGRLTGDGDVSHQLGPFQKVALNELGVLTVGDAEAQIDGTQPILDVEPGASARDDALQGREQGIDCSCARLAPSGRRCGRAAPATLTTGPGARHGYARNGVPSPAESVIAPGAVTAAAKPATAPRSVTAAAKATLAAPESSASSAD
jgi:hypothetical protein